MPAAASVPLTLNADVLIIPVAELSEDARTRAGTQPGEFAVSRVHGRSGSSIVDADAVGLLDRFREPRTVVEAVILFSRERGLDAATVLDGAYPLLRTMVERRVLVPALDGDGEGGDARAADGEWRAGERLAPGTVVRTLQLLDDAAVHLLRDDAGTHVVLKAVRPSSPAGTAAAAARLAHEAAFLAHLAPTGLAPRLLGRGEIDGRAYLAIEHVAGCDADAAAAEARALAARDRGELLALLRAVAAAYARLHAHGVLHGDVHPRNVLVERDGAVRLLDFGLAAPLDAASALPSTAERGGIPFYFEPELARAYLTRTPPPPASPAGEQFAVGAMLHALATGQPWRDFRLGRDEMLRDVVDGVPLPFADRGVPPWPALERVLARALATAPADRFASLADLSAALDAVSPDIESLHAAGARRAPAVADAASSWVERVVAPLAADDAARAPVDTAPTASLTYGAAGIALGLLHVAARRGDPGALAAADRWLARARREIGEPGAFHNAEIQITPDLVGESSPYHAPSGVHLVDALLARAAADPMRQLVATHRFVDASARPAAGLDLTCGRAATLLGAALLLDAAPREAEFDVAPLLETGDAALDDLWRALDPLRPAADGDVEYPGIAHGWAGFLYATLQWCVLSGAPIPADVPRRLDELARLAIPAGRGLDWPWVLRADADSATMPGWCNGSGGHAFLWSLAARADVGGDAARWASLAEGAAWSAWESPEPAATLCCGLAGRAYALLDVHRLTGDARWLDRARRLGDRAMGESGTHREYPHSLYKGEFGVAVLVADLDDPAGATMPGFEPAGYRDAAAPRSRASSASASVTGSSQA